MLQTGSSPSRLISPTCSYAASPCSEANGMVSRSRYQCRPRALYRCSEAYSFTLQHRYTHSSVIARALTWNLSPRDSDKRTYNARTENRRNLSELSTQLTHSHPRDWTISTCHANTCVDRARSHRPAGIQLVTTSGQRRRGVCVSKRPVS